LYKLFACTPYNYALRLVHLLVHRLARTLLSVNALTVQLST
jgi:hypothetical protein